MWVAVVMTVIGVTLLLVSQVISLGLVLQLAPGYAEASASNKPALEMMATALLETTVWANSIGLFLSFLWFAIMGVFLLRLQETE